LLQPPAHFANGDPLYANPVEDLSDDVCFFRHNLATGLAVALVFADVVVTIGRAGEDSDLARLGSVPFPAPAALQDLWAQLLPWDGYREVYHTFCNIVGGVSGENFPSNSGPRPDGFRKTRQVFSGVGRGFP